MSNNTNNTEGFRKEAIDALRAEVQAEVALNGAITTWVTGLAMACKAVFGALTHGSKATDLVIENRSASTVTLYGIVGQIMTLPTGDLKVPSKFHGETDFLRYVVNAAVNTAKAEGGLGIDGIRNLIGVCTTQADAVAKLKVVSREAIEAEKAEKAAKKAEKEEAERTVASCLQAALGGLVAAQKVLAREGYEVSSADRMIGSTLSDGIAQIMAILSPVDGNADKAQKKELVSAV